jgi:hypothetical protein
MRTAIALALLTLVLPAAAVAKGPDARMITLGQYSTHVEPGDPWTATVIVRDGHGQPAAGPPPGLELVGLRGGRYEAVGSPTGQLGVYRVEFDRLPAGAYYIEADDGHGGSVILDTVAIPNVAAGAPAEGSDAGLALPIAGGALLGLLALLALRRHRGGAASPRAA